MSRIVDWNDGDKTQGGSINDGNTETKASNAPYVWIERQFARTLADQPAQPVRRKRP